jgi:uncharacterized protein
MPATLSATFHLTHQCNLRCTYCYTGAKEHIPMGSAVADAGIDFVLSEAQKQRPEYVDITFFGGEPLLEADLLFHVADRLRRELPQGMALNFSTSTNGTLLTTALLHELQRREVYVSLSVDGPPDLHDAQRPNAGGKGSSGAVEKAIPILLKANPCANVTCVLTPFSAGRAAECADWLYERGFRYINLTLDYSAPWTMDDMDNLARSYQQLADWYTQKMRQNARFYLSCFEERIRSHTQGPPSAAERCYLGYRQFSIAPDGALYPCIQFVTTEGLPEFMIGHVLHGGFDEACRSHINGCSEAPKPSCDGCALQGRCASWCACINFASTGTITSPSPVVCHHERMLMPIVDEMANRLWRKRNQMFLHKHYNPSYPLIDYLEQSLRT